LFVIALPGGMASAKSTLWRMLEDNGAHILESDQLAREVVIKGTPAWQEIVDHFGPQVLGPQGEIDRGRLADVIFKNQEERDFLNRITHPRIFQLMADRLREMEASESGKGIVILDIPLLVEVKAGGMFDLVVVVDASPETQVERLIAQRSMSAEEAWLRIRSQASRSERLNAADVIIRNDGSMEDLRAEVNKAWESILERAGEA
jgi:dephospho-CoA kinase